MTADDIIRLLRLEPLAKEGGFYRQTYKSSGLIPASAMPKHNGKRAYGTAIYYLVTPEQFSALHRVPQDEIFHFYLGDPVEMLQITEEGEARTILIGSEIQKGQIPQTVAPGNVWQATRLIDGGNFALLGCTLCPGFEFEDFEIKTRGELIILYPNHEKLIRRFTRG